MKFGKPSALGELWYAETGAPTGPWGKAVKGLSQILCRLDLDDPARVLAHE